MIMDSDPLWHLAAGDYIREHDAIPMSDPWSFTAGDYRWLNISWAWDVAYSYLYENGGWNAAVVFNAIIISLTFTLVYAHCLLRTKNGIASFLTTIAALSLIDLHLRPLQISLLMTALWMLLLGRIARSEITARWLTALPLLTIIWVNCHGGYIIIPVLLGTFWLHALGTKSRKLAKRLIITGIACLFAMLCNPYGIYIFEAAWRPLTTIANSFILEWQPVIGSKFVLIQPMFILPFILLVPWRATPAILPTERRLTFVALLYALITVRFLPSFAIIAAPILACRIATFFKETKTSPRAINFHNQVHKLASQRKTILTAFAATALLCIWLLSTQATTLFNNHPDILSLAPEIEFIETHYPKHRFITEFMMGGQLIYETRGRIPVFFDPRTETAYPKQVIMDFDAFLTLKPGWEEVLDRWQINGVMVSSGALGKRFHAIFDHRAGWKKAFIGPTATIYVKHP